MRFKKKNIIIFIFHVLICVFLCKNVNYVKMTFYVNFFYRNGVHMKQPIMFSVVL